MALSEHEKVALAWLEQQFRMEDTKPADSMEPARSRFTRHRSAWRAGTTLAGRFHNVPAPGREQLDGLGIGTQRFQRCDFGYLRQEVRCGLPRLIAAMRRPRGPRLAKHWGSRNKPPMTFTAARSKNKKSTCRICTTRRQPAPFWKTDKRPRRHVPGRPNACGSSAAPLIPLRSPELRLRAAGFGGG